MIATRQDGIETLSACLWRLHPREMDVLRARYGLFGMRALSVEDAAVTLGIAPASVRRLEDRAIRHLRELALSNRLGGKLCAEMTTA